MPSDRTHPTIQPRSRLRRLGHWAFCAGYILVAAEVFLRLFAPVPMLPRYVVDTPYGIRGNMPDQSYTHQTPEYEVRIRTNSKGVRSDHEIPYEKPAGTKRIVVLGDSFGMGYGVDLEDTFQHRIVEGLAERGIVAETVNLSVSGHGTAEELLALENEGLKYDPDLVLLVWHDTDFQDNVRSGLYRLETGVLTRHGESYLPGVALRKRLMGSGLYRWAIGNCHLYTLIREKAGRAAKSLLSAVRGVRRAERSPVEAPVEGALDGASAVAGMEAQALTLALLHEIERRCESAGGSLLILDVPARMSRTEFLPFFPERAIGGPDGFQVVCPIAYFLESGGGEKLYWERSHGHFTPLGCRLVARAVVDAILDRKLLNGIHRTGER